MDCTRCTGLITRDPQQVDESTTLEFNFTELLAHTNYCLRGVGTYMVVEGVDMPEVTAGEYTILTTLGQYFIDAGALATQMLIIILTTDL